MSNQPSTPPPLSEIERALVQDRISMLRSTLVQFGGEVFSLARWLLASLLAINGGALVFVFSNTPLDDWAMKVAAGCWVAGVVGAILCGFSAYHHAGASTQVTGEVIDVVSGALLSGQVAKDFAEEIQQGGRRIRRTMTFGAASLAAFVVGTVFAAIGFG